MERRFKAGETLIMKRSSAFLFGGEVTRRNFLKQTALASGAIGMGAWSARRAGAKPTLKAAALPDPGQSGIEHIIVVMMENRSFDHFLGWLPNADGKQSNLSYPDKNNILQPTYALAPDFQGCGHPSPDHSYAGGRIEYNGGACDGWLKAGQNDLFSIGYYKQADLSFLGAAAPAWTVCDNYFAAIMSETFPNRIYQHAAQTDRLENTFDACSLPTIWDRLSDASVSRRYYFSDIPMIALWGAKYLPITRKISTFYDDCANDTLPAVSYVDPRFFDENLGTSGDDHPHADIRNGEEFLNKVYAAVTTSPAWSKTVLVINYDEWGGFFDHVAPPTAAIPAADAAAGNADGRLGFRVPCLVISPWSRRGFVAKGLYDHTSILKMIEWRWNLPSLTVRDTNANNLAETLDFSTVNLTAPVFAVPAGPFGGPCLDKIELGRTDNGFSIKWPTGGSLESATNVTGPWIRVTNAANPYVIQGTNSLEFFRVPEEWAPLAKLARSFGFTTD
ncbi:MAG: phospholipase [Verrucomicrobiales bacterium]|nr:phospholipase [Verrucomicrobiales bacterium]